MASDCYFDCSDYDDYFVSGIKIAPHGGGANRISLTKCQAAILLGVILSRWKGLNRGGYFFLGFLCV